MEQLQESAQEALIAPHEVSELLARLTEETTEGIRANEPRTLAGLALETGLPIDRLRSALEEIRGRTRRRWLPWTITAAVFAIAAFAAFRTLPPAAVVPVQVVQAPAPVVSTISKAGLVPLSQVSYGPAYGSELVEDTFYAPAKVPEGISLSASVEGVLWGAGNARSTALTHPLDAKSESALRKDLTELLDFVRVRASKRGLPLETLYGTAPVTFEGQGYETDVQILSYSGTVQVRVGLPPPGKANEADADRIIHRAVDNLIEQLQAQLKQVSP